MVKEEFQNPRPFFYLHGSQVATEAQVPHQPPHASLVRITEVDGTVRQHQAGCQGANSVGFIYFDTKPRMGKGHVGPGTIVVETQTKQGKEKRKEHVWQRQPRLSTQKRTETLMGYGRQGLIHNLTIWPQDWVTKDPVKQRINVDMRSSREIQNLFMGTILQVVQLIIYE